MSNLFELFSIISDKVWQLFQITWPGLDFSIGTIFLGVAFAVVGLRILGIIFGFSANSEPIFFPFHPREDLGGNSERIKIETTRALDVK